MVESPPPITAAAMRQILAAQRHAHEREGPPSRAQRRARLQRLRSALLANRAAIHAAVTADFGHRSRHETELMEVLGVIQAIDYLQRKLRRFMRPERRKVALSYRGGRAWVSYQPKGVVGIMAPWNYPVALSLIPLATALAAGNRAMLKPSEFTPRTSALLARLLAEHFDRAEVAVVLGDAEVGAQFSAQAFDHLLFTGSTQVGRQVMRAASEHLVPLTLELGGKSPAIFARGQIHARYLDALVFGKLSNAGQTCVAPDYVLVHADDIDAFVSGYRAAVARAYPAGPGSDDYTSIIHSAHFERLSGLVADARAKGARVLEVSGGQGGATDRPRTMAPTLILDVSEDMAVMQQEIFGPILPVRCWHELDEVMAYINARPRPLALYYFGPEDEHAAQLLRRTSSGNVGINHCLMHVAQEDLPFGGIGASGMGAYHGIEGFRAMSHAKGIFVQHRWNLPRLLRPPFGRFAELALAVLLGRRGR